MSDNPPKALMRQVLSSNQARCTAALIKLSADPSNIPPTFVPHLLTRAQQIEHPHPLSLSIGLLLRLIQSAPQSSTIAKLTTAAAALRKAPVSTRFAFTAVKLSSALLNHPSYQSAALDYLVAALAALERIAVPPHGPQPRAKRKAISASYRIACATVAAILSDLSAALFAIVERYSKASDDAVAAAALLAPCASTLTEPDRRRLVVLVTTISLKVPHLASRVTRVASDALSRVSVDVIQADILPLIDKSLVREPEKALPSAACLFRAFPSVDLSAAAAKSLVPPVIQSSKSSNASTREHAVKLSHAIASLIFDESTLCNSISSLASVLKTARYPYQKLSILDSIAALTCGAPFKLRACEDALEVLHAWVSSKKESNEDVRLSGYRSIADVLILVRQHESGDVNSLPKICQKGAALLLSAMSGKLSVSDQRAVLILLAEKDRSKHLRIEMFGDTARSQLERLTAPSNNKTKQELALRALTILCEWTLPDGEMAKTFSPSTLKVLQDFNSCPVFMNPSSFDTSKTALCALRCCMLLAQRYPSLWEAAVSSIFRFCVDARAVVSRTAIQNIRELRNSGSSADFSKMLLLLWKDQFSGTNGGASVARSYDFDDGFISAEKLGRTLLAVVLPDVPKEHIPIIVIAANHPRITSCYTRGRPAIKSRYWGHILPKLDKVDSTYSADEVDDWLEKCFSTIFGEVGLWSDDHVSALAAANALVALADERNVFSTRVLRKSVQLLHRPTLRPAQLGPEAFEAIKLVKEAEDARRKAMNPKSDTSNTHKKSKKLTGSSNARLNQERQAQADKARAAAASATVMAEKVEAAKELAKSTEEALRNSDRALRLISRLSNVAPAGIHSLSASMLSLTMPLARIEALESVCRDAVGAFAQTSSNRLRHISVEIATCIYGLERGWDVEERVTNAVFDLKDTLPPALSAEDFSLIAPVIRAALARDPSTVDGGMTSGRRGSSKRRDAIALTKAAAGVLLEHCKPEAIDAAVAAASCRAGSWVVRVLEREDGAFATAADALAFLTGTVLSPGTGSLTQVLEGILSGKSSVRDATLASLARIPPLSSPTISCPRDAALGRSLWLACFDPDEANAELADELWEHYKHPLHVQEDVPVLLGLLGHKEKDIRFMTSKAIALALRGKENEQTRNSCISSMFTMYIEKLPGTPSQDEAVKSGLKRGVPPPVKRGKDRVKADQEAELQDEGWPAREGVARALENLASVAAMSTKDITISFSFLAGRGLGDSNNDVRAHMAKAATAVVQAAGSLGPTVLLPMIEKQLNSECPPSSTKEEVMHADRTRENLVTCLGAVASFLPPSDLRVRDIANQVIKSAMETPSEVVQNAAARCLAPLTPSAFGGEREAEITKSLLGTIWNEHASYGQRRGAAYSLAGVCRGLGLKFVSKSKLILEIETAVAEKNPLRRQGAFLLIETSAILMGRMFEPYVVITVPFLLACMSDGIVEVRNACWAAAQAAMSELSSQGVKMVLPSLVDGLKDRQWRTKAGSAEVLGAMAFCAPRQLALCLPQVVPKLAEALADAHPKVIDAAESAINRIAAVVRSPEVRKLSPFLLAALRDPAGRTRGAVDAMLGSEFVHAIDAASLALLIPPLHRGLRDRSSELKKRSAAIVGSMCNNVANHFDVVPYLDLLLPALRVTLLDAIPDVRRTSARALGALAVSLGEKGLPDVVPWLVSALLGGSRVQEITTERPKIGAATLSSSAERSGAAMGLAEVAASMSERRLEDVLDRVLMAGRSSAEAREGGLMLIAFLPRALGERFEVRIGTSLSAILQGLSDDADSVREAALEAGRNLVSAYAKTSLERLLPELLTAMREKLWRIRQAATRLLGDMLLVIAGAMPDRPDLFGGQDSAGNDEEVNDENDDEDEKEDGEEGDEDEEEEDDENFASPEEAAAAMTTEAAMKVIEEVLGFDRRNEVLAALYIVRCDVSIRVRQTAMQVWKSVVSNTPRVLREIMPSAVRQIVNGLGDEDEERRAAAGKTLGDLSQKLGDRVVPEVLPALRSGITEKGNSERIRKGACEGLGELVLACPKQQLEEHATDLIDAIYQGLSDMLESVRAIAAEVFSSLLKPLGTAAVDAVVPRLLKKLSSDDGTQDEAEIALDGLKQILQSSETRLTSIIVPRLLKERPISVAASRVISTAAIVSEAQFEPYVIDVTEGVVDSMEALQIDEQCDHLESILAAVGGCGDICLKLFMDELINKFNEGYPERRIASSRVCAAFCRAAHADNVSSSAITLLDTLIRQLADTDEEAAMSSWKALLCLSEALPSMELAEHLPVIRQALRAAASGVVAGEEVLVVGLQVPKSPAPFVPILTEALLQGAPELKEQAALCVGELVELTNAKSLGPFVIKLTGPLIRSLSGRVPWQVKAAIIKALHLLIKKGSVMLRSFVPQLQSSFVKSISDGNRMVRMRACAALSAIVPLQPRLEPLLNDLSGLGVTGMSTGARSAAFRACSQVFRLGKKLPDNSFSKIADTIIEGLSDEDEEVWKSAGKCLGFLSVRANDRNGYKELLDKVYGRLEGEDLEYTERVSVIRAVGALYSAAKDREDVEVDDVEPSGEQMFRYMESSFVEVRCACCATVGDLAGLLFKVGERELWSRCVRQLGERAELNGKGEVRMAALIALKEMVKDDVEALYMVVPSLVVCAGETNTGIRDCAERVLRRGFLLGEVLTVDQGRLVQAKQVLEDDDSRFLERKLGKLRLLPESGDENE